MPSTMQYDIMTHYYRDANIWIVNALLCVMK